MTLPELVAHADWSVAPGKRVMCAAALGPDGGYAIEVPRPVGPLDRLFPDLIARADGGAVLFGVDCPIGVPRAWAERAGVAAFADLFDGLGSGRWARFFEVCAAADEICVERPFYPMRPGGTRRAHLADGLGLTDPAGLNRRCDLATANRPRAESMFWTLGGKQVGKAAIACWRDLLLPARRAGLPVRLWPFEGELETLLAPGTVTVAETYPGEVYHHLGVRFGRVRTAGRSGKRQQADRAANAPAIADWAGRAGVALSPALLEALEDGFGPSADGEDAFDALVGACGLLNVALGRRASGEPTEDPALAVEGWILGQEV